MTTIRCVITDDEPVARKGLREYIEKIDYLELVGECEDALQLDGLLKTTQTDLIFLDIQMPYLTGIDYLGSLTHPPKIIITTAYDQYALKGYEMNVADYLVKPITFERFMKAVDKVYRSIVATVGESGRSERPFIFVKTEKLLKKIYLDEILFAESMENYVVIYTADSKDTVYLTLTQLHESLPSDRFIRVHRSYIVNREMIQSVDGNQLCMGKYKIPLARNLREAVLSEILRDSLVRRS